MPNDREVLRPLADLRPELREWASANNLDGVFDDLRHRHVTESALDGDFPATRIHGRWFFDPSRIAEIAQGLRQRTDARGRRSEPASAPVTA